MDPRCGSRRAGVCPGHPGRHAVVSQGDRSSSSGTMTVPPWVAGKPRSTRRPALTPALVDGPAAVQAGRVAPASTARKRPADRRVDGGGYATRRPAGHRRAGMGEGLAGAQRRPGGARPRPPEVGVYLARVKALRARIHAPLDSCRVDAARVTGGECSPWRAKKQSRAVSIHGRYAVAGPARGAAAAARGRVGRGPRAGRSALGPLEGRRVRSGAELGARWYLWGGWVGSRSAGPGGRPGLAGACVSTVDR